MHGARGFRDVGRSVSSSISDLLALIASTTLRGTPAERGVRSGSWEAAAYSFLRRTAVP